VLYTSGTIFETLAKLVFDNPRVENQTLGGLFEGYRQRSELPGPVLDYILEVYNRRNREPPCRSRRDEPADCVFCRGDHAGRVHQDVRTSRKAPR
jgi:hypothetical protein